MSNIDIEVVKDDIAIDSGMVYLNYGEADEIELGPCKGENKFEVETEYKDIEINGLKGKAKGLKRITKQYAKITVTVIALSLENLQRALPGSVITGSKLEGGWKINSAEYLKNVTTIANTFGDTFKKFSIYNALAQGNLEVTLSDNEEGALELVFEAHYDTANPDKSIYSIEDLSSLA